MDEKLTAFKTAFPLTVPIFSGYIFSGISYGMLMHQAGFNCLYPMFSSFFIFAGSIEFLVPGMLLATFAPGNIFLVTLLVNARHLFYGISMLDTYRNTGWKKFYLIFGMCDESFSIISSSKSPKEVNRGWFMFFITFCNHFYWVLGATLGGILGNFLPTDIPGLEFIMTALFVVLFLENFLTEPDHLSSYTGLLISIVCLILFGKSAFVLPTMLLILGFMVLRTKEKGDKDEH